MPCERTNCAQCLTMLALKNDAPGVALFLSNFPKSKPFDPYVFIASDALPFWVREGCLRPKDYGQVIAYLLADSADPHLVCQHIITEHPKRQTDRRITSLRFTRSSKDVNGSALTYYHRASARTW